MSSISIKFSALMDLLPAENSSTDDRLTANITQVEISFSISILREDFLYLSRYLADVSSLP